MVDRATSGVRFLRSEYSIGTVFGEIQIYAKPLQELGLICVELKIGQDLLDCFSIDFNCNRIVNGHDLVEREQQNFAQVLQIGVLLLGKFNVI